MVLLLPAFKVDIESRDIVKIPRAAVKGYLLYFDAHKAILSIEKAPSHRKAPVMEAIWRKAAFCKNGWLFPREGLNGS